MKTLEQMRDQLSAGEFEYSRHALRRVVERNIGEREIRQAGMNASIIEDYPDDKYSPSCLLLGITRAGRPLHMQVSLAGTGRLKIVTIYEPREAEWVNYAQRR